MGTITTRDGTEIHYTDWGSGPPVAFGHGWPLSADAREGQMLFLGAHGYRCIAHDRRGHGRSGEPWSGSEMDTYADDQIVPIEVSAKRAADMIRGAVLEVYPGAPHGLSSTLEDQVNADLLAFLRP